MAFIYKNKNKGFICQNCKAKVPPAKGTIRNHCPYCLYSKHVDINPGDRSEVCHGLMEPICYFVKHGQIILKHKCTKCGKISVNKAASDDNMDKILQLPYCLD